MMEITDVLYLEKNVPIALILPCRWCLESRDGDHKLSKALLKEDWAFIGVHRVNNRYII